LLGVGKRWELEGVFVEVLLGESDAVVLEDLCRIGPHFVFIVDV
jgi:hypothetical protein